MIDKEGNIIVDKNIKNKFPIGQVNNPHKKSMPKNIESFTEENAKKKSKVCNIAASPRSYEDL